VTVIVWVPKGRPEVDSAAAPLVAATLPRSVPVVVS
jgi:hypothetical protein